MPLALPPSKLNATSVDTTATASTSTFTAASIAAFATAATHAYTTPVTTSPAIATSCSCYQNSHLEPPIFNSSKLPSHHSGSPVVTNLPPNQHLAPLPALSAWAASLTTSTDAKKAGSSTLKACNYAMTGSAPMAA
ncbi:hypothetical protein CY34DRAFT_14550 [Suillus luteus UH-Slu-Lm8-n1]|uniref:Uncharacterized protein n=1 Tax=Suillus luteus UH-Slu-Lm8-n1 TaxID=930992 RepID=A0A0D0B5S1_9AGAM|nr:hypothetical protein CY34DRAFT_14550 [Suillus luteus UH-Slu-Lm8-n1]